MDVCNVSCEESPPTPADEEGEADAFILPVGSMCEAPRKAHGAGEAQHMVPVEAAVCVRVRMLHRIVWARQGRAMNLQACSAQRSVSFYACSEALFRQVARVRKAPWAGVHGGLLLACSCSLGTDVLRVPTGKKPAGTYIQGFVDEEGTFWPPGSGRRLFSLSPNMCRPSCKCKFAAARTRARSRAGQRVQAGRALQPALQAVSQLAETVNNQACMQPRHY